MTFGPASGVGNDLGGLHGPPTAQYLEAHGDPLDVIAVAVLDLQPNATLQDLADYPRQTVGVQDFYGLGPWSHRDGRRHLLILTAGHDSSLPFRYPFQ